MFFRQSPKKATWLRLGVGLLLVSILTGGELARRGINGHGRLHALAKGLYHAYRDKHSSRPAYPQSPEPARALIAITIDVGADRHPISPYIYGMAFAPRDYLKDLRLVGNRWGGNDKSRYNWVQGNATNAARDWRWANRKAADSALSAASAATDRFFSDNRALGTTTVMTVPTIGWVARDTDNATTSLSVPDHGEAPTTTAEGAITGYDPEANRNRTSVRSVARKNRPFSDHPTLSEGVVYQDEWIHHLVKTFGNAAQGGIRFYAMDNEPDLWDFTHTDIHPARMGYDDILANFLEYASAVKEVDPTAKVTGPVSSGWTAYLYSSLDRGTDNFRTHADRAKHGDTPFLLWFLKQVKTNDARTGRRSLDVLDVHYYPQGQGVYGSKVDRDTQDRRLRATNSLWDPEYVDESWIDEPVHLLPRLKEWIATGYPGTKLGITEWNFGAEQDMSGALAIADVLGIYGREDVYLANYWAYPPKGAPGYLAFRLFRNADNAGHGFGDMSCRAESADPNRVSCFAATDTSTGDLTVLLINKMHRTMVTAPITFRAWDGVSEKVRMWRLTSAHTNRIVPEWGPTLHNGVAQIVLPPYSIVLVRLRQGRRQSK